VNDHAFLSEHLELTRRYFLGLAASAALVPAALADSQSGEKALAAAVDKIEPYFTPASAFGDVSRGKPVPHSLSEEQKKKVGLTRETWKLEVVSDRDNPAKLGKQFTIKDKNALDFDALLALGKKHAVRFAKVMTCLNMGCTLGMGLWEGVPLRDVVWLTQPKENLRRVFYYGYHNDDPKQMFRSSLPIGRVLEDPTGMPPVILCYKLNGDYLDAKRGGPVRMIVPEGYGFKSVKWLTHVVLTNLYHANDTYAHGNNDVESVLKTFAATLSLSRGPKEKEPIPVTGYAQVGVSGLSKVQVWVRPADKPWPEDDPYFTKAPWKDAKILDAPKKWSKLPDDALPKGTLGFDNEGRPRSWPMRLAKAHWAALLPGLPAGEYVFRCRTVDERGQAQPMPRPFRKSGHCSIESVKLTVG
jgi:DMSO/TMAO reductase YedYZ molybdopterin-dependent catalytic subunit